MSSDYPSGSSQLPSSLGSESSSPAETPLQKATQVFTKFYPGTLLGASLTAGTLAGVTDYSLKSITVADWQEIQQFLKQHLPQESEVFKMLEEKKQNIIQLQGTLKDACKNFYRCSEDAKQKFPIGMGDPMFEVSYFLLDGKCLDNSFFWDSVNATPNSSYDHVEYNVKQLLDEIPQVLCNVDDHILMQEIEKLAFELNYWCYENTDRPHFSDFTAIKTDIHNLLVSGLGELLARESTTS